jgi:hypothetical protein
METAASRRICAREADWRFLLPPADGGVFEHLLLLGGSSELGAYVADLGIARRVSRFPDNENPADLVVVLADADVSIDSLAPQIADQAVLYIEVDRRLPGRRMLTPRRVMRMLTGRGLAISGAYWVKPGFPRRDMYLPLGRRRTLRWYLDSVYRATSPARRVFKRALRQLACSDGAFAAAVPCFAIVAGSGISRRLPALVERMCGARDDRVEPVLLATGEADWNRLVFLLFDGDADRPTSVVKLPRTINFNHAVEREHAVLRDVSAMLPVPLLASIPASTLVRVGERSVTAETCVIGTSVASRSGPRAAGALDDLRCVAAWLTRFHRETTRGHAEAAQWVARELAGRLCGEYAALFGVTPRERDLFDAALRSVDVGSGELPIVWHHADFGPWNIYRAGAHVSVIDWESARRGPALADLLYFVSHWSSAVRGHDTAADRVRHFESLFCAPMPADTIGRAICAELLDYMRAVGVPPALLPHVLLYTVVEQAIERGRRLQKTGGTAPRDIAANEYIGKVDALARHADLLFRESRSRGALYAAS